MRKIKGLLCVLLSCFCIFAFSGCSLLLGALVFTTEAGALTGYLLLKEEKKKELPFELIEDFTIVEVEQKNQEQYLVTVQAIVKNLGEKDSDEFCFDLSFYDENGNLIDEREKEYFSYAGKDEITVMQNSYWMKGNPASIKAENLVMYEKSKKENKTRSVFIGQETFSCLYNEEDCKYYATVSGEAEYQFIGGSTQRINVVFYGTDGYAYLAYKEVYLSGDGYPTAYTVEWIGDVEIVDYKLLLLK